MNELPEVPKEFIEPLWPCFDLLKYGGMLMYDTDKCIWKKYFRLIFNMVCVIAYLCALGMNFGKEIIGEIQMDELAYLVSVFVVSLQAALKAAIVMLKAKELRAIILGTGNMWRTEHLSEVQINKKNAILKRLKFCYAVFYWINIIGSWQYMLAPLLETVFRKFILQQECGLLLPFSCSFPFDPTGNWIRYIIVYFFECYSMFRIIYLHLASEFLMIILCSHLATLFTLLQEDLLNNEPGNHASLKDIIKTHQKLISLSEQLDDVFDKAIFINLSSATITMCFFGLSAKVARGAVPMANNFVAVVNLTLPLFNLCYYGERLREASAGLADSVYNNIWYRGDTRYRHLLLFIMRRSQKPCCLTSIKYSPITLNTFSTVLSTTWSYFSLALSMYEDES